MPRQREPPRTAQPDAATHVQVMAFPAVQQWFSLWMVGCDGGDCGTARAGGAGTPQLVAWMDLVGARRGAADRRLPRRATAHSQGPSVTVTFRTAAGIKPDDTKVQFEGLQIGKLSSVKLQKDLRHVDVTLDLNADMAGHLGPGTRFWIAGKPSLTDLSSIRSIIAGAYIGIDPHPGEKQDHYDGLSHVPALKEGEPGTHYLLTAGSLGSIDRASPIYYHDLQVGTVEATKLQQDGQHFTITAFVSAPFDRLVHAGSHFWNAGAVQLSMSGSRVRGCSSSPCLHCSAAPLHSRPRRGPQPATSRRATPSSRCTTARARPRTFRA